MVEKKKGQKSLKKNPQGKQTSRSALRPSGKKKDPIFIIVTGGVCSSLGKGIATASIGAILKACGFKIFVQKFRILMLIPER